jgi:hypothetical protein
MQSMTAAAAQTAMPQVSAPPSSYYTARDSAPNTSLFPTTIFPVFSAPMPYGQTVPEATKSEKAESKDELLELAVIMLLLRSRP